VKSPKRGRRDSRGRRRRTVRPAKPERLAVGGAIEPANAAPLDAGDDQAAQATEYVVGVGASAGGLEAFSHLLRNLPSNPGFALIVVQHLAPHHESGLTSLLSGQTPMPVVQATEGVRVQPNHVYVIPPNVQMEIREGQLHLTQRPTDRTQYTPIDVFFRSLADDAQDRAIAIVLSGTASDGALGVRDVKAVGGITMAQSPETAKYDGMPRAAIATGAIDLVLEPNEIAAELVRIARHTAEILPSLSANRAAVAAPETTREPALERIFTLLRGTTGVDFKRYKLPTIERRIQRRMLLHKLTRLDEYVRFLDAHKPEILALYQDILIHVTRFFREPESFQALTSVVLPRLMETRHSEQSIRIWVSGCATGEEAYSIAIVLLEFLGDQASGVPIQIFATDISEPAIEHARNGTYPESITADVSPARLRRFFTKSDGGYRIGKLVRDACVFARQDVTRDPPFSKLDLILCRNVLIYLGTDLQKRLMSVFHYALKPQGFLMLGHAETIGTHSDLFSIADKKHRIYQRKSVAPSLAFPVDYTALPPPLGRRAPAPGPETNRSVQNEASRIIQERFAPPGVIIDPDFHIVQFRGHTGPFLEPAPGDPSLSLLKMAREGLLFGLRTVLQDARKHRKTMRKSGLRVRYNGGLRSVNVEVIPVIAGDRDHFLVLFEDVTSTATRKQKPHASPKAARRNAEAIGVATNDLARLQDELASSRDYLQSIIQELEAANEELQSANEEVLSSNEELQSTNEELDTAKEELQSTNEELNTVNEELNARNEELSRVNSDLVNLLASVQIAIVIVASDLRIRRFTPMAERVLNLIPTDAGRPISHIKPNIECPDLEALITEVIDTVTPKEREVQDGQGNWLLLRIRPYKNVDNRIDGAVLTLFDIDGTRRAAEKAPVGAYSDALLSALHEPVLVLDETLHVRLANPAFCERFGLERADVERRLVYDLGRGAWNVPRLRTLLERDVPMGRSTSGVEFVHDFGDAGRRRLRVNAVRVDPGEGDGARIVVCLDDATQPPGNGGTRP
jgi:two-component system CheB/CheR fusion protein